MASAATAARRAGHDEVAAIGSAAFLDIAAQHGGGPGAGGAGQRDPGRGKGHQQSEQRRLAERAPLRAGVGRDRQEVGGGAADDRRHRAPMQGRARSRPARAGSTLVPSISARSRVRAPCTLRMAMVDRRDAAKALAAEAMPMLPMPKRAERDQQQHLPGPVGEAAGAGRRLALVGDPPAAFRKALLEGLADALRGGAGRQARRDSCWCTGCPAAPAGWRRAPRG
jgi:hypothetical protein